MNRRAGYKYVFGQVLLLGSILLSPLLNLGPLQATSHMKAAGTLLFISGLILLLPAFVFLGKLTTPNPVPKNQGELVTKGYYRYIRHPMYTSVMLLSLGWLLFFPSVITFLLTILLFAFLNTKASHEEQWLIQKFGHDYEIYMSKTGKFFPKR